MRLSCAIEARTLPAVDALWKNAFLDDRSWNVAAADIPHKTRVQPDLMLLCSRGKPGRWFDHGWIRWT